MKNVKSQFKKKIQAFLVVCLFLVPLIGLYSVSYAKDTYLSAYNQIVYNQNNGIGNNEVNCILQSSSGYIWIGTDGGLYRYNGSNFAAINLWDTESTDVYSINCLMQDSSGRVWIGTGNYGLFYLKDGEYKHLENEYYDGIKTITDICETEDGSIFVSTPKGMYTVADGNDGNMAMTMLFEDELTGVEFGKIVSDKNTVYAIAGNNDIYIFDKTAGYEVISTLEMTGGDDLKCISYINDRIYVGTSGRNVIAIRDKDNYGLLETDLYGINKIMMDSDDCVWICADNGIGFFGGGNSFTKLSECKIDSYLSDIIEDYEGNYWIASYRMGVLLLSKSKFVDYNMYSGLPETMVNAVFIYKNNQYICTDDGLIIYDITGERVTNSLTEALDGISIRDIIADSDGNLWICTYRKYGLIKYYPDKNTIEEALFSINRGTGLPSNSVNACIELDNGNIAAATSEGIAIVSKSGEILHTFVSKDGLAQDNILCILQDRKGYIYAGTDGGTLYVFQRNISEIIESFDEESGLNANMILSVKEGEKGIWVGTDNGLGFYNDTYRQVSNIEYSNNIYDLIINEDFVWIISSMGVLRTTEDELLDSNGISGRYFDVDDGLNKTINTYSKSFIDKNGVLYICCNTGVSSLDTSDISYNQIAPKIRVTAVDVDGKRYEFDDLANGLKVGHDVTKITIDFAVFSYRNRGDIRVEYKLEGFDEESVLISGNDTMQAVYTNLDGGIYTFHINAYNGDGTPCENEISFTIEKENSFAENPVSRILMVSGILIVVLLLVVGILRMRRSIKNKNKALEKLSKEHEEVIKTSTAKNDYLANMSNEIKTPVNAMVSKADELIKLMDKEDTYRENVQDIYDIGNGILDKVDDIILLAKIEGGRIETVNKPYSVSTIVYNLSEYAKEKIDSENIKLFVEIGDNISDNLIGDEDKIENVLKIFLDNAIQYTKEGSITISVDSYDYNDKEVSMSYTISDTGVGIQEDRLSDIFEVYSIVDNRKNNISKGDGIGLAIAKGYTKLLDGDIAVESVYGAGSNFTLSLNQEIADAAHLDNEREKIEDIVSQEIADKIWLPEVNALVVDDETVSREVSVKTLESFEMKIDTADSGISAIDMVMNNDYDVVFMDLVMPIMNGTDTMKEIRSLDGDKYMLLPIISLDYDAVSDNSDILLENGFTGSLLKPMDIRRVAAMLMDCLPEDKIKEKSSNVAGNIKNSQYAEGLSRLEDDINIKKAIEKIGGSIDVFNKILRSFYRKNSNLKDIIEAHGVEDTRWFKQRIHTLKASSYNVGAYAFSQEAARIEAAINSDNKTYLNNNFDKLLEHLDELMNNIGEYFEFVDGVDGVKAESDDKGYDKKMNDDTDSGEGTVIDIVLLKKLDTLVGIGRFDDADVTLADINKRTYIGEAGDFMTVLNESIKEGDKDKIHELITTYIDLNS